MRSSDIPPSSGETPQFNRRVLQAAQLEQSRTEREYIALAINPEILTAAEEVVDRIWKLLETERDPFHHKMSRPNLIAVIRSIIPEEDTAAATAMANLAREILSHSHDFRTRETPSRPRSSNIATHIKLAQIKLAFRHLRDMRNARNHFDRAYPERGLKFSVVKISREFSEFRLKICSLDEKGSVTGILQNNVPREEVGKILDVESIKLEDITTISELFRDADASLERFPDMNEKSKDDIKAFRTIIEYLSRAVQYLSPAIPELAGKKNEEQELEIPQDPAGAQNGQQEESPPASHPRRDFIQGDVYRQFESIMKEVAGVDGSSEE